MSLFASAQQKAQTVKAEEKDVLGGSFIIPSGIYPSGIKMAYLDKWGSGALYVGFEFAVLVDGKEMNHKELITISNQAGEFTYEKNGEVHPMPGFSMVDSIFRLATGKGFKEQTGVEVKQIKLYDKEAKAEVPKPKEVFMESLGKKLKLGILAQTVDKTEKNPNWQPGMDKKKQYVPTGETREENVISKVFHFESDKTVSEIDANGSAEFFKAWEEKFKGRTINKAKGKPAGASGGTAGAPSQSASSLFN